MLAEFKRVNTVGNFTVQYIDFFNISLNCTLLNKFLSLPTRLSFGFHSHSFSLPINEIYNILKEQELEIAV